MQRCLELAARELAGGSNPMVGSVLVRRRLIIGEGYHEQYSGGPHAEVHCINEAIDRGFARYCLFPGFMYRWNPALILGRHRPARISSSSNTAFRKWSSAAWILFRKWDGKGIGKLNAAGVQTSIGVLEQNCLDLNRRFFCFHTRHRAVHHSQMGRNGGWVHRSRRQNGC